MDANAQSYVAKTTRVIISWTDEQVEKILETEARKYLEQKYGADAKNFQLTVTYHSRYEGGIESYAEAVRQTTEECT